MDSREYTGSRKLWDVEVCGEIAQGCYVDADGQPLSRVPKGFSLPRRLFGSKFDL